jgi:hypothetical protein
VRTTYVWTGIRSAAVGTRDPFAYELAHVHAEADRLLTEALGGWAEKYPDVLVERRPCSTPTSEAAMVRLGETAALTVV